jgi:hypothetical protein
MLLPPRTGGPLGFGPLPLHASSHPDFTGIAARGEMPVLGSHLLGVKNSSFTDATRLCNSLPNEDEIVIVEELDSAGTPNIQENECLCLRQDQSKKDRCSLVSRSGWLSQRTSGCPVHPWDRSGLQTSC